MKYLIIDIENNNSKRYDRKAGNFMFDSIVSIGLCNEEGSYAEYIYPNPIKELKIDEDILVGHNIKHDLLFLWHLPDLQDFFKRQGKIWDTAYAEYILAGHQQKYPKLRDIAVNQYNIKQRTKWIDDLLFHKIEPNSYKQVSDLPKEKVLEDVKNDVEDTREVYLKQRERAEKLGMLPLLELEMDSILATTEMEYNGMFIELNTLLQNKEVLQQELQKELENLRELSTKYWR